MKYLLFMRHCEPKKHPELGYTIDELTFQGKEQALTRAEELRPEINCIISSPGERAFRSAEIISSKRRLSVRTDQNWMEISRGIFTKRPYNDFIAEWAKFGNSYDYVPPGGESVNQGRKRIIEGFRSLVENEQNTLCVTHVGLIANLLMMLYSFKFDNVKPPYGGICELILNEEEVILEPSAYNAFLGINSTYVSPLRRLNLNNACALS